MQVLIKKRDVYNYIVIMCELCDYECSNKVLTKKYALTLLQKQYARKEFKLQKF